MMATGGDIMLISFRAKNVYSFAEEATLSMESTTIKAHSYSLIEPEGRKLLPVMAIYGPNASGKSNLLRTLKDLLTAMASEKGLKSTPFLLEDNENLPSSDLSLEFAIGQREFKYSVRSIFRDLIFESLESREYGKKNYVNVYRRSWDFENEKWELTTSKSAFAKTVCGEVKYVSSMERGQHKLLLASLGARRECAEFAQIYDWAKRSIRYEADPKPDFALRLLSRENRMTSFLSDAEEKKALKEFMRPILPLVSDFSLVKKEVNGEEEKYQLVFSYPLLGENEGLSTLLTGYESEGVYNALLIFPSLYDTLHKGGLLIVDELERSLHPLLMARVVNLFTSPETNPGGGQLIFTTHNTFIMDKKYLRQDEIMFVEKDEAGKSSLYCLSDFEDVRSDLDYCKHYILGAFGAVPTF